MTNHHGSKILLEVRRRVFDVHAYMQELLRKCANHRFRRGIGTPDSKVSYPPQYLVAICQFVRFVAAGNHIRGSPESGISGLASFYFVLPDRIETETAANRCSGQSEGTQGVTSERVNWTRVSRTKRHLSYIIEKKAHPRRKLIRTKFPTHCQSGKTIPYSPSSQVGLVASNFSQALKPGVECPTSNLQTRLQFRNAEATHRRYVSHCIKVHKRRAHLCVISGTGR